MVTSKQGPVAVPGPDGKEQIRLLAEAVDDMRSVLGVLTRHAEYFIPGEAVREMNRAWDEAGGKFDDLLRGLLKQTPVETEAGTHVVLSDETLQSHHLVGPIGTAKTSLLRRLKEKFFHVWNELPSPHVDRTPALAAGVQYLEYGASVAGSIPGAGPIEELLLLYKQHLNMRIKAGGGV